MKTSVIAAALVALAASAAAAHARPVEVTRFSRPELNAAPRGPVVVQPAPGSGSQFEYQFYADAVSRELDRLGYTRGYSGPLTATVDVQRQTYRSENGNGPVSVGVGGSTGGWHSGLGLGLGFNLGGGPRERVETRLAVTIRDAAGTSLWEGRARMVAPAKAPEARGAANAVALARALFQDYPGRSGETITVK